jgi:hypothetical protein
LPTVMPERVETDERPGYPGFIDLAERAGLALEPFQRRIAKAALAPERELLILLPRGTGRRASRLWWRSTTC